MTHLRRIACHIDEPDPGHFYWVLMEEGDDASGWNWSRRMSLTPYGSTR